MLRTLLAILLSASCLTAQTDWTQKIAPELMLEVADGGVEECLIVLKAQADLSGADYLHTKAQKGQYVYETLTKHAEASQKSVRSVLESRQQAYTAFWVINAIWTVADMALLTEIAQLEAVDHIEANPVWKMHLAPQEAQPTNYTTDRNTPINWGLTKIKADSVWALGYTGAGVVVGGQDTGYEWEHPAIKNKYRGWNGSVANHNYNWHDAIRSLINGGANSCGLNLSAPCDDNAHGTHTAGTMVGGPNQDSIIGVAPDAQWIGCRNMEEGDGTPATYIECFQWFIAPTNLANGSPNPFMAPDVINNSWGCPTSEGCNSTNFATMDMVVNNVRAAGIVVVVSAGNSGSACSTVDSPAAIYQGAYSVGATNSSDGIASFSSRGPVNVYGSRMKPNISAPGVSILSCVGVNNSPGTYAYASYQGTSMAGPHVAGMVALIISARPALKGQVALIENIINTTATKLYASAPFCGTDNSSSSPNNVFGYGRINAKAAVDMALNIALPSELIRFEAVKSGKTAVLNWLTASEYQCDRWEIERSADNRNWQSIGQVDCAGAGYAYQFVDAAPLSKVNYYRLRQIDLSGASNISLIRPVTFAAPGVSMLVTPLRADGQLGFDIIGMPDELPRTIRIQSIAGAHLGDYPVGAQGQLILPDMYAGMYVATLLDGQGVILATERFWW